MRPKFFIGGAIILGAILLLIITATRSSGQYYLTVEELLAQKAEMTGRSVRLSGVVLGDTIQVDGAAGTVTFTIAHVPGDMQEIDALGGIAAVLQQAAADPSLPRISVVYHGVQPDLLKHEAQAIVTGKLGADGIFYADGLLLKCPSKYEAK